HRSAIQDFLHRHVVDGFLLDQRHQCAPQPLVRTPDALVELAPLHASMFPLPSMFLQPRASFSGHRPPLCSTTQDRPRLRACSPIHCPIMSKGETMNRNRLLVIGTTFIFALALTAVAQQAATSADAPTSGASVAGHPGVPTAEAQLRFL